MTDNPKIAFIGAGSTVFMKNIVTDVLQRPALKDAHWALMDIDSQRLEESAAVADRLISILGADATVTKHSHQRECLDGAHFVIVAFQIGGFEPCTVSDFEIPKQFGLRQTIADTLGIGGIMRGLRTVPHLWSICEDMQAVCPDALLLQYVNPMAINTWAITKKYPRIKQVGLCHSVQGTIAELARDLDMPPEQLSYDCAGINHMAFYLRLESREPDGSLRDLYPALLKGYAEGRIPKPSAWNERCPNLVRYEMLKRLGYFVTESSEHFAEYVPWFIKRGRPDLIEKFGIPLDEYPLRCREQIKQWDQEVSSLRNAEAIDTTPSHEYAADVINARWTGEPAHIYGNVRNDGWITSLPRECAVEVPCKVDGQGIHPQAVGSLPPQLTALIRTNLNVQELTVAALIDEIPEHIYHAAMLDPHTGAELDLEQIWSLVDSLIEAHDDWLPEWVRSVARKSPNKQIQFTP